ncbi:MAG TPA: recombinase family protein [Albidovulum sp.]|uniref:recombinase family protein n=1 Tax=Albidovulum sp. TaxID=1872424 RepID=UPI002B9C9259|nr:recombinase family protein [Albidovulum sp.]
MDGWAAAAPSRAHLHQILTNPVYSGRIRHRAVIHDGQHPAIIPPAEWEAVQSLLNDGAARPRGKAPAAFASPLAARSSTRPATGDRLTPSHSRKNGHRLRYYISSRLVNDRRGKHPEAWRLPALDLDGRHADALLRALITAVRIAPGRMVITVAAEILAERLQTALNRLDPEGLVLDAPFRIRRRGAEIRVVLGERRAELDRVLIRNLMKARGRLAALTRGEAYAEIAAREGVSKQRVQQLLPLAFLAPDIVQMIAEGRQPVGLTTEWLINAELPIGWGDQRALIVRL